MKVSWQVVEEDLAIQNQLASLAAKRFVPGKFQYFFFQIAVWCFVGIAISISARIIQDGADQKLSGAASLAGLIALILYYLQQKYSKWVFSRARLASFESLPGQATLEITPQGINTSSFGISSNIPWNSIICVQELENCISITIRSLASVLVPCRAFSSIAERQEFLLELRRGTGT